MTKENAVLMREARESLKGKWPLAIGTMLVYMVITIALSSIRDAGWVISLLVSGPMTLGLVIFSLSISRNQEARFEQLFEGFHGFGRALATYLLMSLFIFLWMLLLIIPGIIAGIAYSQTFYILADDHAIGARDALRKSKKMMYGYKWKYFRLGLRFIGWLLLSILTLGIGLLWLWPYMQITMAKFYDDLKEGSTPEATPELSA